MRLLGIIQLPSPSLVPCSVLAQLETALALQILSPLLSFLLMPLLFLPFHSLCLSPPPLPFRLNVLSPVSLVAYLSC
jgi:hypothetical protein